ncbi:unnamed protein product [Effrenium voratum]|nr:unnamed protein product [Effrenium voratum]
MRFCSTRGGPGVSFEEAICRGYAEDGGLYVPEELPSVSLGLAAWRRLSFGELALELLRLFVGEELSASELQEVVHGSYRDFSDPRIVPVVPLKKENAALLVAELFHGPTFCFKDLGQQLLVRLLARFAQRSKSRRTFLVSTTGDTGPAAMRAVADAASPYLQIIVFYPKGQISELQRRQMTTVSGPNARVVTFEGGGDDMDLPLKRISADQDFAKKHGICGINSYNLGRPLAQLPHFFWAYFRALDLLEASEGTELDFVIPAGALGNTAAALIARQMGLPIRRLITGVNQNDITHRTVTTGEFHRSESMVKTLSDAINIQVPYNMERIFYYLTGQSALVKAWMAEMDASGRLTLPSDWLQKMQQIFLSARIDDELMCSTMRRCLEDFGYLPCPHSAVALGASWATESDAARVVFATASPCKFQESVTTALGAEAWQRFQESPSFPSSARMLLEAKETAPDVFEAEATLGP